MSVLSPVDVGFFAGLGFTLHGFIAIRFWAAALSVAGVAFVVISAQPQTMSDVGALVVGIDSPGSLLSESPTNK